jgi:hypothetical protein
MSEDPKVVPIKEGINFATALTAPDGQILFEDFYPPENRERGEELSELLQMTGRLTREEAEEVRELRESRKRTLGRVCVNLLYGAYADDKADGVEKLRRHKLAMKIDSDDDAVYPTATLNKKQKKIILDMAGKYLSTLLYARIHEALDGEMEDEDE